MYIKDITIKNFLSYGEQPTTFTFDKHNITLITAKNGKGKCVDKSTKINVEFLDDDTRRKFMMFVEESM